VHKAGVAMPSARGGSRQAADPIGKFFSALAESGHLPTFEGQSATLRFDLLGAAHPERWYVAVNRGDVSVARHNGSADAIVRMQRPHFAAMVTGRLNAQAAILRGLLTCEGSMAALIMFQRCLPGPPGSTGRVAPISGKTVTEQRRTR
jgi:hypothetical protein